STHCFPGTSHIQIKTPRGIMGRIHYCLMKVPSLVIKILRLQHIIGPEIITKAYQPLTLQGNLDSG
ncbi:hypothetical protein, partial [Vibrio anguillarum]